MNAAMETIYRKIEVEGVWLVDPRQVNYEQQQAILALRKAGRIEQAAYGGLKVKRDWRVKVEAPKPYATRIRDLLATNGITPTREVIECKDARRRPGNSPSWAIALPRDAKIPAAVLEQFAPGWYRNGNIIIVQLKG